MRQAGITDIELIPGSGGVFDVTVDGIKRYSKRQTGRFPTDAEVDTWTHP
ncbi:MAG: Rdx family protein [Gammaproteobacteria bacterium]